METNKSVESIEIFEKKDEINNNEHNETNKIIDNEKNIEIIMRQTTYTREETIHFLNELGTVEKCIKQYLGIKPKEEPNLSTNQKIFKSIRDFF